jgi:glutathione peroxidase
MTMLFVRFARIAGALAALSAVVALAAAPAEAKPEFAQKEGKMCNYCHTSPPERNFRGMYYGTHGHSLANFDEEYEAKAAGVTKDAMGEDAKPTVAAYPKVPVAPALDFTLKSIDGKPVKLARYQGKVVMAVNVASKCGNTPQYKALQALYDKYKDKGLVILGFPANEFGGQEPGTDKEIKAFCTDNYKVTFPMFSKIVVKGEKIHPLYKFLTSEKTDPKFKGDIDWNFAKFLINRKGEVSARYAAKVQPDSDDVVAEIEKLLEEKAAEKTE